MAKMHELKTSFKIGAGVTSKFYFRYLTKFPLKTKCKNVCRTGIILIFFCGEKRWMSNLVINISWIFLGERIAACCLGVSSRSSFAKDYVSCIAPAAQASRAARSQPKLSLSNEKASSGAVLYGRKN